MDLSIDVSILYCSICNNKEDTYNKIVQCPECKFKGHTFCWVRQAAKCFHCGRDFLREFSHSTGLLSLEGDEFKKMNKLQQGSFLLTLLEKETQKKRIEDLENEVSSLKKEICELTYVFLYCVCVCLTFAVEELLSHKSGQRKY